MTVQRILSAMPKVNMHIAPDATIAEVLQSPEFEANGVLVVSSDGGRVEGIITERDVVCGLKRIGPDLLSMPAQDLMTEKVLTCAPEDRAAGIMALMVFRHVLHLPVVTNGKLVGIVSVHDLLHLRLKEVRSDAEAMQNYITGTV